MIKHIVILFFLQTLVHAHQNALPPSHTNLHKHPKGEDMNIKIKGIARGIVDKWISEGLTITRDKVEGWISKIDEAKEKDMKKKKLDNDGKVANENTKQPTANVNNLGNNFEDVKETVVKTFTKIGEVTCEDCKKTKEGNVEQDHINEAPKKMKNNVDQNKYNDNLENLSVEELIQKQEAIKQYLQMEKIAKLANVAKDFSEIEKLKDIANLANNMKILTKSTAKEEL